MQNTMLKAVLLQIGATTLAALLAAYMFGTRGVVSAALGGAACFLPNLLFALRLSLASRGPGTSYPAVFFVGEIFKLAASVGLLAAVLFVYDDVHLLALFIGLILALKANLFAFLVKN
jgi:ATP synthase protein I